MSKKKARESRAVVTGSAGGGAGAIPPRPILTNEDLDALLAKTVANLLSAGCTSIIIAANAPQGDVLNWRLRHEGERFHFLQLAVQSASYLTATIGQMAVSAISPAPGANCEVK